MNGQQNSIQFTHFADGKHFLGKPKGLHFFVYLIMKQKLQMHTSCCKYVINIFLKNEQKNQLNTKMFHSQKKVRTRVVLNLF